MWVQFWLASSAILISFPAFHLDCAGSTDLKRRLDRATYCFRTQIFETIGAILVGPNLLLIGGIQSINEKYIENIPPSTSKILRVAFDNPCRVISHDSSLGPTRSFLDPSKMAAAAIFWLYFLNNWSSIQSFFEISGRTQWIAKVWGGDQGT